MPEATTEAFTEGWFRTGDIGHLDEDGFLFITDRKKDLIVTAGGKNIAPQPIETLVGKDHYIEQVAVVGDKRKFVSAIIVPAFENLVEFAKQKKLALQGSRRTDQAARGGRAVHQSHPQPLGEPGAVREDQAVHPGGEAVLAEDR